MMLFALGIGATGFAGLVHTWIEREHRIESADVKGLDHKTRRSRHPHLAARRRNLVVTGNEAADAGTVDPGDTRHIENYDALCLAQNIAHAGWDLFAFRPHHHLARDRDHNHIRRNLVMAYLHQYEAPHCTFVPTRARLIRQNWLHGSLGG